MSFRGTVEFRAYDEIGLMWDQIRADVESENNYYEYWADQDRTDAPHFILRHRN